MKKADVQKLQHGLYKVHWKSSEGGGTSLASVGSLYDGSRWLAPTNWTTGEGKTNPTGCGQKTWSSVEKMELICR